MHSVLFSADPERAKSLDADMTELNASRANSPKGIPFLDRFRNGQKVHAFLIESLSFARNALSDSETTRQDTERIILPLDKADSEVFTLGRSNEANGLGTSNFLHKRISFECYLAGASAPARLPRIEATEFYPTLD